MRNAYNIVLEEIKFGKLHIFLGKIPSYITIYKTISYISYSINMFHHSYTCVGKSMDISNILKNLTIFLLYGLFSFCSKQNNFLWKLNIARKLCLFMCIHS